MKMLFTNESSLLVNNVKNLIEAQAIKVFIKNEYAQGAVGGISAFDAWPELWVVNEVDFDHAMDIVSISQKDNDSIDWHCTHCKESNDSSFELCWNCQHEST
jgi:hypothetical protein